MDFNQIRHEVIIDGHEQLKSPLHCSHFFMHSVLTGSLFDVLRVSVFFIVKPK